MLKTLLLDFGEASYKPAEPIHFAFFSDPTFTANPNKFFAHTLCIEPEQKQDPKTRNSNIQVFLYSSSLKVHVHTYSLHVCDAVTASICGGRLLLRRALKPIPLIAALVKSGQVVKATTDSLQKILDYYKCGLKRATTKTAKIKELMRLSVVTSNTSPEERKNVEELLAAMDSKRNKQQEAKANDADQDEEAPG